MILAPSCSRLCCAARSIWFRTIRPNNALSSSKRGTNGPRETTSSRTSASGTATCARCATPCKSLRIVCGINGILAYGAHAPAVDYGELMRTRDAMSSRGPDGAGAWLTGDRRLGLAHRRLAIIDLTEAGAQPMHSADGRFIVTFNGEIYNYPQLRTQFEREGAVLRSHSDTAILIFPHHPRQPRGQPLALAGAERHRALHLGPHPSLLRVLEVPIGLGDLRKAVHAAARGEQPEEIPDQLRVAKPLADRAHDRLFRRPLDPRARSEEHTSELQSP